MWLKRQLRRQSLIVGELLDSKVFDTLAGSMADRIKVIIKPNGWYTKY